MYEISQVYRACGVDLGDVHLYPGQPLPGHAVVVPPRMHRGGLLPNLKRIVTFAVTGWAMHARTRGRLGVDHAIPLSDHADYDELFEAVERVQPRVIYCTHGPESFVDCLRAAGHNAHPLDGSRPETPTGRAAVVAVLIGVAGVAAPSPFKSKPGAGHSGANSWKIQGRIAAETACPLVAAGAAMLHFGPENLPL